MSPQAQVVFAVVAVCCFVFGVWRALGAAYGEVTRLINGYLFMLTGAGIIIAGAVGVFS